MLTLPKIKRLYSYSCLESEEHRTEAAMGHASQTLLSALITYSELEIW